jgi:hypothetical protein
MSQEEIYIKLLQGERVSPEDIPKEFLRNFQFCKVALEELSIKNFSESQQREMNLQAVEMHFHASKWIWLQCDIPEIVRLVPENALGDLDLGNSQIGELPQLESARGSLYLENSQIKKLPQLKSVGWYLNLRDSQIKKLPQLKSIGGSLSLENSQIRELPQLERIGKLLTLWNSQIREFPKLESVGKKIFVDKGDLQYWKDYFTQTNRPHLAEKVIH